MGSHSPTQALRTGPLWTGALPHEFYCGRKRGSHRRQRFTPGRASRAAAAPCDPGSLCCAARRVSPLLRDTPSGRRLLQGAVETVRGAPFSGGWSRSGGDCGAPVPMSAARGPRSDGFPLTPSAEAAPAPRGRRCSGLPHRGHGGVWDGRRSGRLAGKSESSAATGERRWRPVSGNGGWVGGGWVGPGTEDRNGVTQSGHDSGRRCGH